MLDGRRQLSAPCSVHAANCLPRKLAGLHLEPLRCPVFRSQLNHCIEDYNGDIMGYQFQKQMVGLLLRTFPCVPDTAHLCNDTYFLHPQQAAMFVCPFPICTLAAQKQFSIYFLQIGNSSTAVSSTGLEVYSSLCVVSLYTAMLNRSILKSSFTASKSGTCQSAAGFPSMYPPHAATFPPYPKPATRRH